MDQLSDARNLAKLAREIAMDIIDIGDILKMNDLTSEEWGRISSDPRFQSMLGQMVLDWNAASNTRQRIKIKAQTAVEMLLDPLIREVMTSDAPLVQKTDAIRQIARLGELEQSEVGGGQAGDKVSIVINIGAPGVEPLTIDAIPVKSDG